MDNEWRRRGFSANLSLQFTTDGTTWVNSGWAVSPAYPYDSSAATGATYAFTGANTSVRGVRISGQEHTPTGSSFWENMREVEAYQNVVGPDTTAPSTPLNLTATSPGLHQQIV